MLLLLLLSLALLLASLLMQLTLPVLLALLELLLTRLLPLWLSLDALPGRFLLLRLSSFLPSSLHLPSLPLLLGRLLGP